MIRMRHAALAAIAVLVAASATASFCESYRGLLLWAEHHGLHGIWAAAFPAQVDTFIAVGELALFVALADSWPGRSRVAAWCVTVLGMAVSVAGNVGHIAGHDLASRFTAAVPPLAAASALAVGLGVLKRVVAARSSDSTSETVTEAITEPVSEITAGPVIAPPVARSPQRPRRKHAAKSRRGGSLPQRKAARAALEAEAVAILDAEPTVGATELARRLDVSVSTAQRLRREIRTAQPVS